MRGVSWPSAWRISLAINAPNGHSLRNKPLSWTLSGSSAQTASSVATPPAASPAAAASPTRRNATARTARGAVRNVSWVSAKRWFLCRDLERRGCLASAEDEGQQLFPAIEVAPYEIATSRFNPDFEFVDEYHRMLIHGALRPAPSTRHHYQRRSTRSSGIALCQPMELESQDSSGTHPH
jgi:hypothetical protein